MGPVPPERDRDAYDRLRRRILWSLPTGLYLVGSRATVEGLDQQNLMTANWITQVANDPKLVSVAVEAEAVTARLIGLGGGFAVSVLARQDRAVVRRFVKPVTELEQAADGSVVAMAGEAVTSTATGLPVLARAAAWLECSVRHRLPLGSHVLFVGEICDARARGSGGRPGGDDDAGPAEVLRMEDTRMNYGG